MLLWVWVLLFFLSSLLAFGFCRGSDSDMGNDKPDHLPDLLLLLKEQYNTREVVVYGHRQTPNSKKNPGSQNSSPIIATYKAANQSTHDERM